MSEGAIIQGDEASRRDVDDAADVVIVGSGAAGATAARVLTEAGLDVVMVEEGPHVPPDERRVDAYGSFKRLWRDAGFQVAQGRAFMPVLQGCAVGGSTIVNGAIIHRLPEAVYAEWKGERAVDRAFSYDRLSQIFDRMDGELRVAPAPEAVLGGNNRMMRRGLEALGVEGRPIRRNVDGCEGSARCNQGCPKARKQSMDASYVPFAVGRGARVYATCRVERVVERGGRAAEVRARFVGGGRASVRLRARRAVVIAAGAVHTPLLLAASGVGRRSGLVGRRFQAHPATSVLGLFDEPVDMWSGATQGFETLAFWNERMKFETASVPIEILAARMPGFGEGLIELLSRARHVAQWGVEVRARAMGEVGPGPFGRPLIRYDLTDDDVRLVKLGVARLCRMMLAAGAREVMPGVHGLPARVSDPRVVDRIEQLPDDPRLFHCITGHVFGTAVMGEDASRSVVGLDGESHDLPGLYVLDASVFPTNIGVNPQHSIAGLAWVMAEGISQGRARR